MAVHTNDSAMPFVLLLMTLSLRDILSSPGEMDIVFVSEIIGSFTK